MQALAALGVVCLIASSACAFVACSSSDANDDAASAAGDDASNDTTPAATDDAAAVTIDAATTDTGAAPDAALAKGESVSVESAMTAMSCDAVCAAKKYTCGSTTCATLGATLGVAAYLGGTSVSLASCATVPAATSGGAKLVREDCCCVTPFVILMGPTPTKSCADVCTAAGLSCDDKHDWGKAGIGGMDAQYERPSTTASQDQAEACSKLATATISLTKPTEKGQLTHYSCACVSP
jgi:hypothetical protein